MLNTSQMIIRRVVFITALFVLPVLATVGHWITTPVPGERLPEVVKLIIEKGEAVCDYHKEYGFLLPAGDAEYLTGVTAIKWQAVEKEDLQQFMDKHNYDYVYHGYIHITNRAHETEIAIGNWPVASTKRPDIKFLSGGTASYTVSRRLPSILNFFYDEFIIFEGPKLVS